MTVEIGVVANHVVRARSFDLERRLGGLAALELGRARPSGRRLSAALRRGGIDEQDMVTARIQPRLEQEWNVQDEKGRTLSPAVVGDPRLDRLEHRRVYEGFESLPCRGVAEYVPCEPRPVRLTVRSYGLGAERGDQTTVRCGARECFASEAIGVHDLGVHQTGQTLGDRGLAGAHAS